ncbi:acyl-CoA dehydrogenase [Desulfatitalea tepidiphila]|uniref:acyl-CoA dehydrogenase n=1 Tax=Desulfatitalea tepidiphila TaxID=1185843 RepID=UPI0006B5726C|nr:acyl-CoA dehydrogenase [Desulfatitalea tepidiphila]
MAQVITDRRDIDFILYEQLDTEALLKEKKYGAFTRKTLDLIINEARSFALKELLPICAEGDRQGVTFDNNEVKVPACFHRAHKLYLEGEWTSLTEPVELGGQGLPPSVARAVAEYMVGANYTCVNYANFGHGTGKMIDLFGTEEQKRLFVKKLYTAEWTGGMLLTESDAGSDVGALTTEAVKNDDGTYSITGSKIFITNGEHDLSENIISPVLARVKGAPEGTKGISIFIVPKYWVNPDGSLGDRNDIYCTGIEEKMGIHGSACCTMTMGSKGQCRGMLLGEENQGMKIMFHMMNEARLGVGFQAFVHGSVAYQYALNYARERIQGKDMTAGKDSPSVPIIRHPDVRRMLMWMKSYVEGMRSFIYYTESLFAKASLAPTDEERKRLKGLIGLYTPLIKAFSAQRGFDITVQAMQVYGGAGYCKEYPVEQQLRDCKIASIYEGTDGIQAMDLLGRKIVMDGGKAFGDFLKEIQAVVDAAKQKEGLADLAGQVEAAAGRLGQVAMALGKTIMSPNVKQAFAHAFPFLEAMGDVIMAWMRLWRANVAVDAIAKGVKAKDEAFYRGQIKTSEFFIQTVLPCTLGKMASIEQMSNAAVEMDEAWFGN